MKIYLISSTINNETFYKIGITRQNIENRLRQLKTGNPATLNIINYFESKWASKIEANLHSRFSSYNVEGGGTEWFSLTPETISNFTNICQKLHETFQLLSINNTWIIDKKIL